MKQKESVEESPYDIVQIHIGAATDSVIGVLGIYLFVDYFDTVRGKKQARQAAEKRKLDEQLERRDSNHHSDPIEQPDRNTHR